MRRPPLHGQSQNCTAVKNRVRKPFFTVAHAFAALHSRFAEKEFFIDNLLVRIHSIIEMV